MKKGEIIRGTILAIAWILLLPVSIVISFVFNPLAMIYNIYIQKRTIREELDAIRMGWTNKAKKRSDYIRYGIL